MSVDAVIQTLKREKGVYRIICGHISEVRAFSSRSGSSMGSFVIRPKRCSICCIELTPSTKLMASPVLPIQVILAAGEGEHGGIN